MTKQTPVDRELDAVEDGLGVVADPSLNTEVAASALADGTEGEASAIIAGPSANVETVASASADGPRAPKGKKVKLDEPATTTIAEEVEVRRPGKDEVTLTYRGSADLLEYGDYRFRPDQPVIVPSDVAEELLTLPFEKFEKEKE